jgi:pimeloyl-ACP methyl ester carboxylesterase
MDRTVRINGVLCNLARNVVIRKERVAFRSRLNATVLTVCIGFSGCAVSRQEKVHPTQAGTGVVFVVDGAGNFQATSDALRKAVEEAGLPLSIVTVEWSHGYARVIADHTDWNHAQEEGCQLAGEIAAYRQAHPASAVYLLAHSAGSSVALTAASLLPPDSLDRIILLAPSVSTAFELRPALRSAREGMDVFYSRRDLFSLGVGVALIGTADGCRDRKAAGRCGFQSQPQSPEDEILYARLRQHPWERWQLWTGNHGCHSGTKQPKFLHAYVLPLLGGCPDPRAESNGYFSSAETADFGL